MSERRGVETEEEATEERAETSSEHDTQSVSSVASAADLFKTFCEFQGCDRDIEDCCEPGYPVDSVPEHALKVKVKSIKSAGKLTFSTSSEPHLLTCPLSPSPRMSAVRERLARKLGICQDMLELVLEDGQILGWGLCLPNQRFDMLMNAHQLFEWPNLFETADIWLSIGEQPVYDYLWLREPRLAKSQALKDAKSVMRSAREYNDELEIEDSQTYESVGRLTENGLKTLIASEKPDNLQEQLGSFVKKLHELHVGIRRNMKKEILIAVLVLNRTFRWERCPTDLVLSFAYPEGWKG